ncbi:MAG: hypothetical protein LC635_03465 [Pseudonocardiaceae bacterium]|nr:hypothetical protein [Pseudonocardiaceae bacterium]
MGHKLFTVAVPAAIAAGILGLAVANSSASSAPAPSPTSEAASHSGRHLVLKFVEHETGVSQSDVAPAGPSSGDMYFGANPLFNASNTRQVGMQFGSCVLATPTGTYLLCDLTYQLDRDMITVHGVFDRGANKVTSVVTGGTGRYLNARGQADSVFGQAESTHTLTLTL